MLGPCTLVSGLGAGSRTPVSGLGAGDMYLPKMGLRKPKNASGREGETRKGEGGRE